MSFRTPRLALSIASLALAFGASAASAAPIINVGTKTLLAGTANQKVQIFAGGGDSVDGLNFFVATGNGGSAVGGTDNSAPKLTGVSLNGAGALFAGRTQATPDQTPQFFSASINSTSALAVANGSLIAELTIDTTGFSAGTSYPLALAFTPQSGIPNTAFTLAGNDVAAQITNGTLSIVAAPEPTALAGIAAGTLVLARRRRRRA